MSKRTSLILILVAIVAIAFMAMTFDTNTENGASPATTSDMGQARENNMTDYKVIPTEEGTMPQYDSGSEAIGNETSDMDMSTPEPEMEAEPETPAATEPMNP